MHEETEREAHRADREQGRCWDAERRDRLAGRKGSIMLAETMEEIKRLSGV